MTKKEMMLRVFHNEETDRIPIGFWFHFLPAEFHHAGMDDLSLLDTTRAGHKKFIDEFQPDMVKVMTDGLFTRPFNTFPKVEVAKDLYSLEPLPADDPYFAESLKLALDVREMAGDDMLVIYNVFSPLFNLAKFMHDNDELTGVYEFIKDDPEAVRHALTVLAEDMKHMVRLVLTEGKMDGIYMSVNNSREVIPADIYRELIRPSDLAVLDEANACGGEQVLHICGNRTRKNDLAAYRDYPVTVFNWAVHEEGMSLAEGKKYFHGKCVVGGFNQYPGSLIHKGTKEEIEKAVEDMLDGCGKTGVIIGADCTVPSDTPLEHLEWVRQKAKELSK